MKVCFLSCFGDLLQMDTGPSTRIYYLARSISQLGNEVQMVIPGDDSEFEWSDGLHVHKLNGVLPEKILKFLSMILGVLRPTSLYFYDLLFILKTFRIMQECDVIQIEQPWATGLFIPFFAKILRKPLIVDSHDVFQSLRTERANVRRVLETFLESVAYRWANMVLTVSEEEKETLAKYGVPGDKIVVIGNGVDTESFVPLVDGTSVSSKLPEKKRNVVFVGNMEYWPNKEAVVLIESQIAPRVLEELEDVKFFIVGRGISRAKRSSITFTGSVEDVRDYLNMSQVAIAPLLHGSGTRLKILEYFSCALPVVSTTVGVEGLDVNDGVNVWVEDDVEEFANRIVQLLSNGELREQVGTAARELVVSKYDWHAMGKRLNDVYNELLS